MVKLTPQNLIILPEDGLILPYLSFNIFSPVVTMEKFLSFVEIATIPRQSLKK